MLKLKAALLAAVLAGSAIAASDADAHGRYRHRSNVGIWFGAPIVPVVPFYYGPRYYYPPAVAYPGPVAPPVYIEQPQAGPPVASSPAESSAAYWYYCRDTQTYYPYVQQCASPWERVVPQGAPPS